MDIKEVYYCNDCNEFADLAVFKDKYVCPSCGVYDEITGEVQMQGEWEEYIFIVFSIGWILGVI